VTRNLTFQTQTLVYLLETQYPSRLTSIIAIAFHTNMTPQLTDVFRTDVIKFLKQQLQIVLLPAEVLLAVIERQMNTILATQPTMGPITGDNK